MSRYKVTFPEVRHPETGQLVPRGKYINTETERGERQADVLVKVGRLEPAPRAVPVRKVAEVQPAKKRAVKTGYRTRRLKAGD